MNRPASCPPLLRRHSAKVLCLLCFVPLARAAQPAQAPQAACTLADGIYRCDLQVFKDDFARARTIRIETERLDRTAASQLRNLVLQLGKQPLTGSATADLLFALTPVQSTGVSYGPGDHDLATLRVYGVAPAGEQGDLLWVETLRGQGDRPWPAQVHLLVEQFRNRLSGK